MSRSVVADAARLARAVPWQVWALLGVGLGAAYLSRRAADAAGSVVGAAVGAAQDVAVGAARVALSPVLAVAAIADPVGRAVAGTATGAAVGDAVFGAGSVVADAVQSFPGATDALDAVFGVFDKITGVRP